MSDNNNAIVKLEIIPKLKFRKVNVTLLKRVSNILFTSLEGLIQSPVTGKL